MRARSTENLQRVGFLACLPAVLQSFGVDPAEVLRGAGLESHVLNDADNTIPYLSMGLLVQVAAEKTRCPHLGLIIGSKITTNTLGFIGELMRHSETLRAALRNFATHQHRHAHGGVVYLVEDEHTASFGYAVYEPHVPGHDVICDGAAMGALSLVLELAGQEVTSAFQVLLSRSRPEDAAPYRRALGAGAVFDAAENAVLFPRKLLDTPMPETDEAVRGRLKKQVNELWYAGGLETEDTLRRTLMLGLLQGDVSASGIASTMGLGRRTLDRRLESLGLSFREVLDEARCEYAEQLLASTRLEIGMVATIVGFNDPSVLTRAFTRWTGKTPSAWRLDLATSLHKQR